MFLGLYAECKHGASITMQRQLVPKLKSYADWPLLFYNKSETEFWGLP